jgi:hypothetical protein
MPRRWRRARQRRAWRDAHSRAARAPWLWWVGVARRARCRRCCGRWSARAQRRLPCRWAARGRAWHRTPAPAATARRARRHRHAKQKQQRQRRAAHCRWAASEPSMRRRHDELPLPLPPPRLGWSLGRPQRSLPRLGAPTWPTPTSLALERPWPLLLLVDAHLRAGGRRAKRKAEPKRGETREERSGSASRWRRKRQRRPKRARQASTNTAHETRADALPAPLAVARALTRQALAIGRLLCLHGPTTGNAACRELATAPCIALCLANACTAGCAGLIGGGGR